MIDLIFFENLKLEKCFLEATMLDLHENTVSNL